VREGPPTRWAFASPARGGPPRAALPQRPLQRQHPPQGSPATRRTSTRFAPEPTDPMPQRSCAELTPPRRPRVAVGLRQRPRRCWQGSGPGVAGAAGTLGMKMRRWLPRSGGSGRPPVSGADARPGRNSIVSGAGGRASAIAGASERDPARSARDSSSSAAATRSATMLATARRAKAGAAGCPANGEYEVRSRRKEVGSPHLLRCQRGPSRCTADTNSSAPLALTTGPPKAQPRDRGAIPVSRCQPRRFT
jgi:hypothetical protein